MNKETFFWKFKNFEYSLDHIKDIYSFYELLCEKIDPLLSQDDLNTEICIVGSDLYYK